MSSVVVTTTARPDFDVILKNVGEFASVGLDSLYKLPKAAAAQGKRYNQKQAHEHQQSYGQQLESFSNTLQECRLFADNVEMLRDNLSTASAKEVRSVGEDMVAAGKKIQFQVVESTRKLEQYSQATPYDNVWPTTQVKSRALVVKSNQTLLDGPQLRAQFQNSLKDLVRSFNQISDFWKEQTATLETLLGGKGGTFGLTAEQVTTLATRWARYSIAITETVHTIVKICDALKVEPALKRTSGLLRFFSLFLASRDRRG